MLLLRASIVIVAVVLSSHADACSMPVGWRPLSAVERLLNAREVLFATVLRTFPDHGFGYGAGRTTAYTAEVDVHCILKGHRSESIINITRAGHVPGLCHTTNLVVGHRYFILVMLDDGVYMASSAELPADSDEQLANLTIACGLQPTYPKEVDEAKATVKCPIPAPPGKCKNKQDFEQAVAGTVPSKSDDRDDYYSDNDDSKPHAGRSMEGKSAGHSWRRLPYAVVLCFILLTWWSVDIVTASS